MTSPTPDLDNATIAHAVRDLAHVIHAELDTAAEPDHGPRNVASLLADYFAHALADYFAHAQYRSSTADAAAHRFAAIVAALHRQPPRLGVGHVLAEGHDRATCPVCRTRGTTKATR